jgi:3-isopropylmalate/(R)-2-methylmalate dehydratase large subunit
MTLGSTRTKMSDEGDRHARITPRSLFDKVWSDHVVADLGGDTTLVAIDRILLHERTGAIALRELDNAGRPIADASRAFCTMDHIVDTLPGRGDTTRVPGGEALIVETRSRAKLNGLQLFDVQSPEQGIVHVISPELGIVLPGATLVCPDSHTCTQGALGAFAWGIGTTEAEHALATGTLRVRKPKSMRVTFDGRLGRGVTAKDLSLALISAYGSVGGNGHLVEFAGSTVRNLDIEGRLTLCNMATEFSAVSALIAPDEKTFEYLAGRKFAPRGAMWEAAVDYWRTLRSDPEATFDREIKLCADEFAPMITWGTSPQLAVPVTGTVPTYEDSGTTREAYERAIGYMGIEPGTAMSELTIEGAFIGSCTNSRITDLRRAAAILRGRKVAQGVRAVCVPGSTSVKRQAESEGLHRIFVDAGFEWRESGCSMCFYAGGESFGYRERVVSSTNRNFESRQGPQTRTHIASPETVATSAIAGRIADVRELVS